MNEGDSISILKTFHDKLGHAVPREKSVRPHSIKPFLVFHFHVGIRLALRVLAPVLGLFFFIYYFLRWEFFAQLARIVFVEARPIESGLALSVLVFPAAASSAPRVLAGLGGWMRSLPADGRAQRRLASLSVFVSVLWALFILAFFAAFVLAGQGASVVVRVSGLLVLGWAAAGFLLPVENKVLSRVLLGLAGILAPSGEPALLAAACLLVISEDRLAGDLLVKKSGPTVREARSLRFISARIALRSLRFRLILLYLISISVLAASIPFLKNNRFSPAVASAALRTVSSLSLAAFFAFLSHFLGSRRPVWPWARSLPWSSRRKILQDSAFQFLLASPLFIVVGQKDPASGLAVACFSLFLAFRAAAAMREAGDSRLGPFGRVLGEGMILGLCLGLVSWSWVLILISTPVAVILAEKADRAQKAGRWEERHHLSAGDSQSWSDR
ncbi:MAG: hypothetical protein A2Y69_13010 [Candidatus Aminicenantes bacterium RBG_13_59_9]|nr:MAG: hypothetical protein A2Y69_13010 [Candidatus Aminicenantes bacterium RBG_13_59_9]